MPRHAAPSARTRRTAVVAGGALSLVMLSGVVAGAASALEVPATGGVTGAVTGPLLAPSPSPSPSASKAPRSAVSPVTDTLGGVAPAPWARS